MEECTCNGWGVLMLTGHKRFLRVVLRPLPDLTSNKSTSTIPCTIARRSSGSRLDNLWNNVSSRSAFEFCIEFKFTRRSDCNNSNFFIADGVFCRPSFIDWKSIIKLSFSSLLSFGINDLFWNFSKDDEVLSFRRRCSSFDWVNKLFTCHFWNCSFIVSDSSTFECVFDFGDTSAINFFEHNKRHPFNKLYQNSQSNRERILRDSHS